MGLVELNCNKTWTAAGRLYPLFKILVLSAAGLCFNQFYFEGIFHGYIILISHWLRRCIYDCRNTWPSPTTTAQQQQQHADENTKDEWTQQRPTAQVSGWHGWLDEKYSKHQTNKQSGSGVWQHWAPGSCNNPSLQSSTVLQHLRPSTRIQVPLLQQSRFW